MPDSREQNLSKIRARVLNYWASKVGRDRAEDIAQETLIVLEMKYSHVTDVEEMTRLSIKIARLVGFGEGRVTGRHTGEPIEGDYDRFSSGAPSPEQQALDNQRRRLLREAVAKQDPRCRELIERFCDGFSIEEIASLMGAARRNTIDVWLNRCKKTLREILNPGGAK